MKIKTDDLAYLTQKITPLVAQFPAAMESYKANPKIKNPGMALRWEALRAAGLTPWICTHLYSYLDDTHIDTALRHVMNEIFPDAAN